MTDITFGEGTLSGGYLVGIPSCYFWMVYSYSEKQEEKKS